MVDGHLINLALAGLGVSAGIAVLIAVAIIAVSAVVLGNRKHGGVGTPAKLSLVEIANSETREPVAAGRAA
jgi:hypothetical protein